MMAKSHFLYKAVTVLLLTSSSLNAKGGINEMWINKALIEVIIGFIGFLALA